MSGDGAHQGVGAERALDTILGGKAAPEADEQMDPVAFEAYIRAAPDQPNTYGDGARLIAKLALEVMLAHPEIVWADVPSEDDVKLPEGDMPWEERWAARTILREGFDTHWKRLNSDTYQLAMGIGPTGFMWGWGVNAARRCCELGPVNNPALLSIRTRENPE